MVLNYLTIARRNLQKRKLYSIINALGLSIGLAFCVLIFLYVKDELSFDRFHTNLDRIYRIEEKSFDTWEHDPNKPYRRSAWLQTILQPTIKEECAEVEWATRYSPDGRGILRYEDKVFTEDITYVDADFFHMFSFGWLRGNQAKVFSTPDEVVITPAIAKKYFGDEDPLGKTLDIEHEGRKTFTVTGLIEPAPPHSSLHYQILVPQPNRPYYQRNMENWGNFNTPTFIQLKPGATTAAMKASLNRIVDKYLKEKTDGWRKRATVPIPEDAVMLEFMLTPLADVHLFKEVSWEKVSDVQYSWILGGIAILILFIACINYVSLALTTSASRKTEVGIRKVVGAQQRQLVYQFTFESISLAFISMVIGIGLTFLFLPVFNIFTGKGIVITGLLFGQIVAVGVVLAVVVGLLAGSYPAAFLSGFRPALVLKGGFTSKLRAGFTQPLVVLQFAMSAFLVISSVVMYRQMKFITTKDLGYRGDQTLVIPTQTGWNNEANRTIENFRQRARQEPLIASVTGTSSSFNQGYSRWGFTVEGEQKSAYVYAVDSDFIPALAIELAMGRNFDPTRVADSAAIIVNEALVRDMNWANPLEEHLNWQEDSTSAGSPIIGVAKDYHFLSLEREIEPMFLSIDAKNVGYLTTMLVKISGQDVPAGLDKVKGIWQELYPDRPFDYTFLDDDVARQYRTYSRWMKIVGLSTGFAILISCLGLFGLAGINAVNRTREIGIRKVMGAGWAHIFVLLNRPYVGLAVLAFVVAGPFSWYVMTQWWLKDFQYKITLGWELFAVSFLCGLVVALLAVSYHGIKATLINPAETLKYE